MSEAPVPQPQPQTIVQAGGRVAESLVSGFSGAPALLLIVVLNIAMIIVAGFYLLKQDEQRNEVAIGILDLVKACILETQPLRANPDHRPTGGNTP